MLLLEIKDTGQDVQISADVYSALTQSLRLKSCSVLELVESKSSIRHPTT